MNYAIHYERLIERARGRILVGYCERHHILPRCMDGGNEQNNIVRLTAEEHYVSHQLLVKMYPHVNGLVIAAVRMAKQCSGNKAYGWLKRKLSDVKRNSKTMLGKKHSEETKMKISIANRGKVLSLEARQKISAIHKGKKRPPQSTEWSAKISTALKGRKRAHFSIETRKKMSAWQLGLPKPSSLGNKANLGNKASPETKAKMSIAQQEQRLREARL